LGAADAIETRSKKEQFMIPPSRGSISSSETGGACSSTGFNDGIPQQRCRAQKAQIQPLERGKLCIIRHGPDGPYYKYPTWENGKNVSR
jgi:hypothetical protein